MSTATVIGLGCAAALYLISKVAASVAIQEATGWLQVLGLALIRSAVDRLPAAQRQRWEAEWRAEFESRSNRPVSALFYAWGVRGSVSEFVLELGGQDGEFVADDEKEAKPPAEMIRTWAKEDVANIHEQYDMGLIPAPERLQGVLSKTADVGWVRRTPYVARSVWVIARSEIDGVVWPLRRWLRSRARRAQ